MRVREIDGGEEGEMRVRDVGGGRLSGVKGHRRLGSLRRVFLDGVCESVV
jgi:hypothetical protein